MLNPIFAEALGKIPSGIFVITTKKGNKEAALLASWVQQAAFNPPTLTVAVNKDRPMNGMLTDQSFFTVHILGEDQKELMQRFAKSPKKEADLFKNLKVRSTSTGFIILEDAIAYLECRVRQRVDAGDHHLILADIMYGRIQADGKPRIHIRKNGLGY